LDVAIRVARRTGRPLKVAARLPLPYHDDPSAQADRTYFNDVVRPLLDGPDVEFLGELGARDRGPILGGAEALLFPIDWPEPFGLVMAESLACGTFVLALRAGSVPEVVEHGQTGFICEDEGDLVDAVQHLPKIDRAQCRTAAERRFSPAAMASAYEQVYARLLAGSESTRTNGLHAVELPLTR
jgi:glycosyltransferase involved in cell wall biosynthesis